VGVFDPGTGGDAWRGGSIGQCATPGRWPCASFALVSAAPQTQVLQILRSGTTTIVEMHLPTDRPGIVLRCRINASSQDLSRLRRHLHRALNHRRSAWAIAGMVLLLAVCGYVGGGSGGVRWAMTGGMPRSDGLAISTEAMYRWFGARLLRPVDMPALFDVLADLCRRAGLSRLPDLYYLAAPNNMNAYAVGGPEGAAIILTEGLLRGMTLAEIAGILAHEVAHISNNDAWAISWAAALHRAIEWTSLAGLALLLQAQTGGAAAGRPPAMLLSAAPAIGQLLCLALSRVRELDADATALELTDDSQALVAALDKLERHHTGSPAVPVAAFEEGPIRFLRSHPATWERVGTLLSLAR
jgi:heat shock protein HtpX